MTYPISPHDVERWTALRRMDILDTPPDPCIDRLCALAQRCFEMPIVLVSLVDQERQWFKARCGIDLVQTPRSQAFCNYTILADDVFVVPDARADQRFFDNPLVVGEPFIRSYIGAPLIVDGLAIGTLCALDVKPRQFSPADLADFREHAKLVLSHLELHRSTRELGMSLAKSEARRALMASQADEIRKRAAVTKQTERLAGVGGWDVELATGRVTCSDNLYDILGLPRSAVVDRDAIYRRLAPDQVKRLERAFKSCSAGAEFEFEAPLTTPKGEQRWVRISGAVEFAGSVAEREFGVVHDVTKRHDDEARLQWLATHDELTGLPNRVLLRERLEQLMAEPAQPCALMAVDVDHFKDVNERFGVPVGDAVLIEVGRRLCKAAPAEATVCRVGDDEFAVLLPGVVDESEAFQFAERLLEALRMRDTLDTGMPDCRASVGVALLPAGGRASTGLANAGLALLEAKSEGRDRCAFFHPRLGQAVCRRVEILRTAREALDTGRVFPFYQPKYTATTGELVGFEALMRWRSETGDIRSPGMLSEAFEDPGLAVRIGDAMLRQVINDIDAWRGESLPFGHVALNASAAELRQSDYATRVLGELAARHLPPTCLEVEVTETVFLDRDAKAVSGALFELDAAGVALALDDFGTGFASLTHLRKFPVRWLKIDRSFVSEIESDANAAVIVEALITLGHSLGIGLVAEGVETSEQLRFLADRGCDLIQGYLLGKPMPAEAARELLRTAQHVSYRHDAAAHSGSAASQVCNQANATQSPATSTLRKRCGLIAALSG